MTMLATDGETAEAAPQRDPQLTIVTRRAVKHGREIPSGDVDKAFAEQAELTIDGPVTFVDARLKRSDLPRLALVELEPFMSLPKRDMLLIEGKATHTCTFDVVHMPSGTPDGVAEGSRYHRDTPMFALLIPDASLGRVDYQTLQQITEAETNAGQHGD